MKEQEALKHLEAGIRIQQAICDAIMAAHEFGDDGWRRDDKKWINKKYSKQRRLLEAFQRAKHNIEIARQAKEG